MSHNLGKEQKEKGAVVIYAKYTQQVSIRDRILGLWSQRSLTLLSCSYKPRQAQNLLSIDLTLQPLLELSIIYRSPFTFKLSQLRAQEFHHAHTRLSLSPLPSNCIWVQWVRHLPSTWWALVRSPAPHRVPWTPLGVIPKYRVKSKPWALPGVALKNKRNTN